MYCDGTSLTSLANAIRTAGGTSAQLQFPEGIISAIDNIGVSSGYNVEIGTWGDTSTQVSSWSQNVSFTPEGAVLVRVDTRGQYYNMVCAASSSDEGTGNYGISQARTLSGPGGLLKTPIVLGANSVSLTNPVVDDNGTMRDSGLKGVYLYVIWGK